MKTIAEIMSEPATVEEIIRRANAINERLKEVENMPRLVAVPAWFYDEEPEHGICPNCAGNGCSTCNYIGEI